MNHVIITGRLGADIELRQQGVEIRREMKEGKNRYGEKTRYAVYSLEEKKC